MILSHYPQCDANPEHVATIHCPECEESFCAECDSLIHMRKKTRDHVREPIEIEEPVVEIPCDSDPSHVAILFCEDCDENFCNECDQLFHSRKKTVDHRRYEGARQLPTTSLTQQIQQANLLGTPPPEKTASGKTIIKSALPPSASSTTSTSSTSSSSTAKSADAKKPAVDKSAKVKKAGGKKKSGPSSEDRVAEHKQAWNDLRLELCKKRYNVGHWLGLSTENRKELGILLCQELLFNPQSSDSGDDTVTVEWSTQSYWTTYEVDVSCTKTVNERNKVKVTTYKVHIDDSGRLADFEIVTDGQSANGCAIM